MEAAATECQQCGASGELGDCRGLFDVLLGLDHARLQPWGQFHGLNVACYFLQHPRDSTAEAAGGQWQVVTTFLREGLAATNAWEAEQVRLNRAARHSVGYVELPPRLSASSFTVADVSVDGTFPADGYADRMHWWAASVVAERSSA